MSTEIEQPKTEGLAAVASGDLLATPVEIPELKGYRAFCTVANIGGTEIAILGGSVEAIAAAWARLVPTVPFKHDRHQQVIVLSAKSPMFNVANDQAHR